MSTFFKKDKSPLLSKQPSSKNDSSKQLSSQKDTSKQSSSRSDSSKQPSSKDDSSKQAARKDDFSKQVSSKNDSSKQASSNDDSSKKPSSKNDSLKKSGKHDSCRRGTSKLAPIQESYESKLFGGPAAMDWPLGASYNPHSWYWAPEKSTRRFYQPGPEDYRDLRLCVENLDSFAEEYMDNLVFDVISELLDFVCSMVVGFATLVLILALFFIMMGATGVLLFVIYSFSFLKFLVECCRRINSFFNPWNTQRRVPSIQTIPPRRQHVD